MEEGGFLVWRSVSGCTKRRLIIIIVIIKRLMKPPSLLVDICLMIGGELAGGWQLDVEKMNVKLIKWILSTEASPPPI